MKCADCGKDLVAAQEGGVRLDKCLNCGSIWLLDRNFKRLKDTQDKFVRWIDPELWSDIGKHEIGRGSRMCPGCGRALREVRYADSDVVIDICPDCRGVWLHKGEIDKIVSYLEGIVDTETIRNYLKGLGHEATELLTHKEKLTDELRDMGILMKLLEYRIISRFPALSRIAAKLPPV